MVKNQQVEKTTKRDSLDQSALAEMAFEEALADLEEIVDKMEDNRMSLEDSISSYEKGIQIIKHCQAKLNAAGKRIEILEKTPINNETDQSDSTSIDIDKGSKGVRGIRKKKIDINESSGEPVLSNKIQGSLLDFAD